MKEAEAVDTKYTNFHDLKEWKIQNFLRPRRADFGQKCPLLGDNRFFKGLEASNQKFNV